MWEKAAEIQAWIESENLFLVSQETFDRSPVGGVKGAEWDDLVNEPMEAFNLRDSQYRDDGKEEEEDEDEDEDQDDGNRDSGNIRSVFYALDCNTRQCKYVIKPVAKSIHKECWDQSDHRRGSIVMADESNDGGDILASNGIDASLIVVGIQVQLLAYLLREDRVVMLSDSLEMDEESHSDVLYTGEPFIDDMLVANYDKSCPLTHYQLLQQIIKKKFPDGTQPTHQALLTDHLEWDKFLLQLYLFAISKARDQNVENWGVVVKDDGDSSFTIEFVRFDLESDGTYLNIKQYGVSSERLREDLFEDIWTMAKQLIASCLYANSAWIEKVFVESDKDWLSGEINALDWREMFDDLTIKLHSLERELKSQVDGQGCCGGCLSWLFSPTAPSPILENFDDVVNEKLLAHVELLSRELPKYEALTFFTNESCCSCCSCLFTSNGQTSDDYSVDEETKRGVDFVNDEEGRDIDDSLHGSLIPSFNRATSGRATLPLNPLRSQSVDGQDPSKRQDRLSL